MEKNQKILYEHFKKQSEEHKDPLIREKLKGYAAEILKSFPQFEKKAEVKTEEKPKEDKPKSKEK